LPEQLALITGASSGIGASLALFLAEKGFRVALTARREDRLRKIEQSIHPLGGRCSIYPADLSIAAERERLFKEVSAQAGTVDVLVNNAGFGWYGYYADMTWPLAQQMVDVNILAVMHLTTLFLPGMVDRGRGHIINISSIAGGLPNQGIGVYSGSKAFVDAFSTALYREYVGSGVSVSAMRLGPVETEFYDQARNQENGGSIPAERFAVSVDRVNRAFWRLLRRPRRAVYVPGWLSVSKHVENIFGNVIDLLGPLLLKKDKK
jgi:short-subunit dehydrogenase